MDPNDGQRYRFPRTILRAGGAVIVHTGSGHNRARSSLLGAGPVWNNDGDTALLKNPSRRTVDRCSYNGTEGGTKVC